MFWKPLHFSTCEKRATGCIEHHQSLLAPPVDISDSLAELRAILEVGGSSYENCSFLLRHDIERTESINPLQHNLEVDSLYSKSANKGFFYVYELESHAREPSERFF
jgi:hypothetical protein